MAEECFYAIIGNIPPKFRSSDLRNYFSQCVETSSFECFHFRHRPESIKHKKTEKTGQSGTNTSDTTTTSNSDISSRLNSRTCCVIKLSEKAKLDELIKMYHRKHWLDRSGESISTLCYITRIKVIKPTFSSGVTKYKTRSEQRLISTDREVFTQEDLKALPEMNPPHIMPNGNVGTPTKHFLELIQACKLPPIVIKKLGLVFPKLRTNRRYGCVPFNYGGKTLKSNLEEDLVIEDACGHKIESENDLILNSNSSTSINTVQTDYKDEEEKQSQHSDEAVSEEDDDGGEEWERHEALNDDPANLERNKERLYEQDIELKWEKGGPGLVWYTDAQFWDEREGDFDMKTSDDWDLDMSVYYENNGGDMDSRDHVMLRRQQRRRDGEEDTDRWTCGIGKFEKHTKGIGRKVMQMQGWKEGQGLGSSTSGISDALDAEGQLTSDKSGLGYRGEIIHRYFPVPKRSRTEDTVIISTVYDDPEETDPPGSSLRRNHPHSITYRPEIKFKKAKTTDLYRGEIIHRYFPVPKRSRTEDTVIISTVYDDPEETDPPGSSLRRNHPHSITYRPEIKFKKAKTTDL